MSPEKKLKEKRGVNAENSEKNPQKMDLEHTNNRQQTNGNDHVLIVPTTGEALREELVKYFNK